MNSSRLALATALVLSFGMTTLHASPVVIGEPSKGTHVTTLQDGNGKVEITTTGIRIEDGRDDKIGDKNAAAGATSEDDEDDVKIQRGGINIRAQNMSEKLEDIVVPIAFFVFLLSVILGAKYISSRNEQRRLELLKVMVEKGQPVPEAVVNQILVPQVQPETGDARLTYKRYRNAYGFSIAGIALMSYAMLNHTLDGAAMVSGLVFLCLGAGSMAGLYLPKNRGTEKIG